MDSRIVESTSETGTLSQEFIFHEELQSGESDGERSGVLKNFGPDSVYESFCRYAQSYEFHNREIAIVNFPHALSVLCLNCKDEHITEFYFMYETIILRETDVRLRCLLLDQIPSVLADLLRLEVLGGRPLWFAVTVLLQSLAQDNEEIWKCAFGAIGQIVLRDLFTRKILEKEICPALLKYSFDDSGNASFFKGEHRLEVVTLLCQIIAQRGKVSLQWIHKEFTGPLSRLLQDSSTHIKKVCTSVLGDLALMFGRPFTEAFVVPFMVVLSADAMWGVRKECCEVFVDVARVCSLNVRMTELAPCFITLLKDSSRWVCTVAYQNLGPFIVLFAESTTIPWNSSEKPSVSSEDVVDIPSKEDEEAYGELPADVILPPRKEVKQEMDVLTSLIDSWAMVKDGSTNELMDDAVDSCGVAAFCSTHNDLTKLIDEDDIFANEIEKQEGNAFRQEEDEDKEENYNTFVYWMRTECPEPEMEACYYDKSEPLSPNSYYQKRFDRLVDLTSKSNQEECNRELEMNDTAYLLVKNNNLSSDDCERNRTEVSKYFDDAAFDDQDKDEVEFESFDQGVVPKDLLDTYRHMVSNCCTSESDINRHCAHNFPAVAYALGRNNWLEIKDTYLKLAADIQWRVRQSLASSMHEVAAIIGEENTDSDLVPVFKQFMSDVEEVKLGILKHLSDFFRAASSGMRENLITILATFLHSDSENEKNWRFRYEYTWQCVFLCDLYDVEDLNKYIAAIALTLANDRIAYVRKVASYLLSKILVNFVMSDRQRNCNENCKSEADEMAITTTFVEDILKGFARSKNWRRRQTFAYFCEHCIDGRVLRRKESNDCVLTREEFNTDEYCLTKDEFCYFLLKDFLKLAEDAVPNIRIAFLCAVSNPRGKAWFLSDYDGPVRSFLSRLIQDSEVDCRRAARSAMGLLDSEHFIEVKTPGKLRDCDKALMKRWTENEQS